jgi:lysophospholipase L1-like esterase
MKLKSFLLIFILCAPLCVAQQKTADKSNEIAKVDDKAKVSSTIRIVLAGDSTVNHSSGWGSGFCDDLVGHVECFNMSKNGRSTKSYRDEGWWQRALDLKPTYILIQFGANDVPGKGPERETDPKSTYPALLKLDIEEARAAGVKPVLVTPMEVRYYDKAGKLVRPLADYADAARQLAAETKTPLIDLTAATDACLSTMTAKQSEAYDKFYPDNPTLVDRAHINAAGSQMIGAMVAEGLVKAVPGLAKYISMQDAPVENPACR